MIPISIRKPKAIHTATHPGRIAQAAAEEVLAALEREAMEEDEGRGSHGQLARGSK